MRIFVLTIDIFSQILYDNCERVIFMSTKSLVYDRINKSSYKAYTSSDFLDLDNYKNVSKALETLEDNNLIHRAKRGIYYLAKQNELLGIAEPPNIDEIARAIARQYNFNIIPSSNYALNLIGISTQVPASYTYITDGPYNEYQIGKTIIKFKHATSKEINGLRYKNLIAIQAIKSLGRENITDKIKSQIAHFLDNEDIYELRHNSIKITAWIYDLLKEIIGGNN